MSTICQKNFLSPQSVVASYLEGAETESTGHKHPIDLPLVDIEKVQHTFGAKIDCGFHAAVLRVAEVTPPRVYKVIPGSIWDGDEIRISQKASELGVAPTFYSAFLVKRETKKFVCIEMDDAGKSLRKWMEKFAETDQAGESNASPSNEPDFGVDGSREKKRAAMEDTLDKLYPHHLHFYRPLLARITTLAEHNISYPDIHAGNIMPNIQSDKGLQLIDFDGAYIANSKEEALHGSLQKHHTPLHTQLLYVSQQLNS